MNDLFAVEQKIYDDAVSYVAELKNGVLFDLKKIEQFTEDYGKLLKQFRKLTIISDRTTLSLNTSKEYLLEKVYFDSLTGIYNRRFLEENMQRIIRTYSRSNSFLSVLMADIDYFKNYNDTYGHTKGDICLKDVAQALENSLSRGSDFAARYGGEEFMILLPDTNENGALKIAEKLLKNVIALNIPHSDSAVADCVTISIGVTTGKVEHKQTNEDYFLRADEALYLSKNSGRNKYTFKAFKEN